jgi:hypothetical protein
MRQMPDLQNLQNCGDLTDGEINEKSTFSFAKEPIATLQFNGLEGLTPENFERLCCRLMAKLFNLHGCRRYARGRNQQGIDIIGYRSASPDNLVVIQCKRHVDFDLSTFKDALQEFKRGSFYGKASEFIVLASCQLLPRSVEEEAAKVHEELFMNQCLFDIWNGEKISWELRRYPEIVEAFYRQEVVRAFCQPWEIRQRLLEVMVKSYQDRGGIPLSEKIIPDEDQDYLERTLTEQTVSLGGYEPLDKHFCYTDAFIRIESFLPTQRDYYTSCLITIKQQNLHGGFFSLGHANIIRLFVRGSRTSIRKYRAFFLHEFRSRDQCIIAVQLGSGGAYLHDKSFKALCEASDALAEAYINALKELEAVWEAQRFPFTQTDSVVVFLGHIPTWLWNAILRFAERHDVAAGASDWHMFDAPSGWLKVYTKSQTKSLNRGYHALISTAEVSHAASSSRRVRLFWHPPSMLRETIGERDFWTCEFTFNWLRDKLIPKVLQEVWSAERRRPWMNRRRQRYEAEFRTWVQENQIVDPRSPHLTSYDGAQGMQGLWTVLSELQNKFSIDKCDFPVSGETMGGICKMLSFLALRAEMDYWSYVSSNLQLTATNKQAIISEIESKEKLIASEEDATWMVDVAMRAAMEMVRNGDIQLAADEVSSCLGLLRPIIEIYELSDLIDRHTPQCE